MDGRYNQRDYRYLIEFSKVNTFGTGVLDFDRARRWFNDQFGWSQDIETRDNMLVNRQYNRDLYEDKDLNPVWAYAVKYGDYRIYVDSEQTLSWFVLCHPNS